MIHLQPKPHSKPNQLLDDMSMFEKVYHVIDLRKACNQQHRKMDNGPPFASRIHIQTLLMKCGFLVLYQIGHGKKHFGFANHAGEVFLHVGHMHVGLLLDGIRFVDFLFQPGMIIGLADICRIHGRLRYFQGNK